MVAQFIRYAIHLDDVTLYFPLSLMDSADRKYFALKSLHNFQFSGCEYFQIERKHVGRPFSD